jgi:hypothetical protein
MRTIPFRLAGLLLLAAFPLSTASAQVDFKKQIERGRYVQLADKLEDNLELAKADPKLAAYLRANIDYLRRGAVPKVAGSEIVLVRGAKNDKLYQMPRANGQKRKDDHPQLFAEPQSYPSGGPRLMLPNRIRFLHMKWDKRLTYFGRYFKEATTLLGGDGDTLHELDRIIEHHKGGGLGTSANSVKSVLISSSTRPLWSFGPPYYLIKIAPERCIFNHKGLSGEYEVLIPFWILPHEIVARCDSMQAVLDHPVYKASKLKDVPFYEGGFGGENNWAKIEANVRAGRLPLPLDQGEPEGEVEVNAGKVYLKTAAGSLLVTPPAVARALRRFKGKQARLDADVAGDTLIAKSVLSPLYKPLQASVDGDELILDGGARVSASGNGARVLSLAVGRVSLQGYLFTDAADRPLSYEVRYVEAKLAESVTLRRPLGTVAPAGTAVTIRYSRGKSAIVRTADGAWGWVSLSKLTVGEAAVGLSGAIPIGN